MIIKQNFDKIIYKAKFQKVQSVSHQAREVENQLSLENKNQKNLIKK